MRRFIIMIAVLLLINCNKNSKQNDLVLKAEKKKNSSIFKIDEGCH